jgi:histidinol dehydrogenase
LNTVIKYPDWSQAKSLLERPEMVGAAARRETVASLLAEIKKEGDAAVRRLAARFDGTTPDVLSVSEAELTIAEKKLPENLKKAIETAYHNIYRFHEAQWGEREMTVTTMPGVVCSRKSVPIDRVGLYIPGGTAPLFSTALMLGVPAQIAGCREVVLCSPPQKEGGIHPAVLFAARLCGIRQVFQVGGVQAIGAMAYGTESIPQVWKIFGPGNAWVTAAKQLVSLEGTAIDMPAGPSEVAVMADAHANPAFIAADLLSQAEHGADSQVLLVSDDLYLIQKVQDALQEQLATLPRRDFAAAALQHSKALLVRDLAEGMDWINAYAPEHLILHTENPHRWAERVTNAGSVFLGGFTPESAGDYASGTNHTLPTNGYARVSGGVSLDSFLKKITFQEISRSGLEALGPVIVAMAEAEGLDAHARAVAIRIGKGIKSM